VQPNNKTPARSNAPINAIALFIFPPFTASQKIRDGINAPRFLRALHEGMKHKTKKKKKEKNAGGVI
jgi:hypothetical protein